METTEIFGVRLSRLGLDEATRACQERVQSRQGGYVCFVNVHSLTESTRDKVLHDTLNGAYLAAADGLPLVWTSRLMRAPIQGRACGPDFLENWFKTDRKLTQGFIGGAPGQAEKLRQRFDSQAPIYSPPLRPFSEGAAAEDWKTFLDSCPGGKAPNVIWVGLGAPKQEFWMRAVSRLAPETLFFGVGAAFDFFSGTKSRAPRWMQKTGLEWLHRLMSEPQRLWKRYLVTNSLFVLKLIPELMRK